MSDEKVFVNVRINHLTRLLKFSLEEIKDPGIFVTKSKSFKKTQSEHSN